MWFEGFEIHQTETEIKVEIPRPTSDSQFEPSSPSCFRSDGKRCVATLSVSFPGHPMFTTSYLNAGRLLSSLPSSTPSSLVSSSSPITYILRFVSASPGLFHRDPWSSHFVSVRLAILLTPLIPDPAPVSDPGPDNPLFIVHPSVCNPSGKVSPIRRCGEGESPTQLVSFLVSSIRARATRFGYGCGCGMFMWVWIWVREFDPDLDLDFDPDLGLRA
jgi:hypothetical protein